MKVWNFTIIAITLMLVLTLTGYNSGFDNVLEEAIGYSYDPSTDSGNINFELANFFEYIFTSSTALLTGLVLAISAATGFKAGASVENLLLGSLASAILVIFISTFTSIITTSLAEGSIWFSSIMIVIFLPLTVGYSLALAEFLRGTD